MFWICCADVRSCSGFALVLLMTLHSSQTRPCETTELVSARSPRLLENNCAEKAPQRVSVQRTINCSLRLRHLFFRLVGFNQCCICLGFQFFQLQANMYRNDRSCVRHFAEGCDLRRRRLVSWQKGWVRFGGFLGDRRCLFGSFW